MPTDLTKVSDHPATLLETRPSGVPALDIPRILTDAAFLRNYERLMSVTFAALDNDTLAAVREAYSYFSPRSQHFDYVPVAAVLWLLTALDALLGLED